MTAHIVVVGSLNMDLVIRTPHIPQPGESILGRDFQTLPGGKGANQAVAAARIGAQVTMVGRVGRDGFGETLLGTLAAAGIDNQYVIKDESAATGVALIVVDEAGQNSIVVASGANMSLTVDDVIAAEAAIAAADVLLLQLESPLAVVERAAEVATQHGVTVILNPAPAQKLPTSLLSKVDILIPNETETSLLTGLTLSTPIEQAAEALFDLGVGKIIMTLGEKGAMYIDHDGHELVPAFKIAPVDTTAAGDAFVGGFAVALAEKQPLAKAVRWGNASGALAATKMGAQPSLPDRAALLALLDK